MWGSKDMANKDWPCHTSVGKAWETTDPWRRAPRASPMQKAVRGTGWARIWRAAGIPQPDAEARTPGIREMAD